jgi:hypothetical protein
LDRRDALREFEENRELYKLRKVAEGSFGGIGNRYGARVSCKLLHLEVYCILLMVVAHNLRTLMRVRAQNKEEFFICFLINSTSMLIPRSSTFRLFFIHPLLLFFGAKPHTSIRGRGRNMVFARGPQSNPRGHSRSFTTEVPPPH